MGPGGEAVKSGALLATGGRLSTTGGGLSTTGAPSGSGEGGVPGGMTAAPGGATPPAPGPGGVWGPLPVTVDLRTVLPVEAGPVSCWQTVEGSGVLLLGCAHGAVAVCGVCGVFLVCVTHTNTHCLCQMYL